MSRPRVVVFAGPNGSGKSTLTHHLIERHLLPTEHIDPDRLAQESGDRSRPATPSSLLRAHRLREKYLSEGRSFCFETVLSHRGWIDFFDRAHRLGFEVLVYYIGIGDPFENIIRVRIRMAEGGHAVPDDIVRERWFRSMELLSTIAASVDRLLVFDNSRRDLEGAITPVAQTTLIDGQCRCEIFPHAPDWVRAYLADPPAT